MSAIIGSPLNRQALENRIIDEAAELTLRICSHNLILHEAQIAGNLFPSNREISYLEGVKARNFFRSFTPQEVTTFCVRALDFYKARLLAKQESISKNLETGEYVISSCYMDSQIHPLLEPVLPTFSDQELSLKEAQLKQALLACDFTLEEDLIVDSSPYPPDFLTDLFGISTEQVNRIKQAVYERLHAFSGNATKGNSSLLLDSIRIEEVNRARLEEWEATKKQMDDPSPVES